MSRKSLRAPVALTVTLRNQTGGTMVTCRTIDISHDGMNLDTVVAFAEGQRVAVVVMTEQGPAFDMAGVVVRALRGRNPSLGIRLQAPPVAWRHFVEAKSGNAKPSKKPSRRHVLVVGNERRQRGAMAIYLASGCDVVFVPSRDLDDVRGALVESRYDAVITEIDPGDAAWGAVLALTKQIQPDAHRIVRTLGALPAGVPRGLVHRTVDRDSGVGALLDALEH